MNVYPSMVLVTFCIHGNDKQKKTTAWHSIVDDVEKDKDRDKELEYGQETEEEMSSPCKEWDRNCLQAFNARRRRKSLSFVRFENPVVHIYFTLLKMHFIHKLC